jgi:hypothetical protein
MIDHPGDHPLPHAELPTQNPLIFTLHKGDVLYRHHQSVHNPIFFGTTGNYRFDDPDCPASGAFGVLYAGADPECCLLESCGSTTDASSFWSFPRCTTDCPNGVDRRASFCRPY